MASRLSGDGKIDTITAASTASNLPNYGIVTLGSSAGTTKAYTLNDPVAGCELSICATGASTAQTVTCSTAVGNATFNGTNHVLTFTGVTQSVHLRGISATRWAIVGNVGSVAAS